MDPHAVQRADYTHVMGPELGLLWHELQDDFGWLKEKWLEHKALYRGGQERIDLLNSVASSFFFFLNNLLYESVILHLCRLTDPPRSCGKGTLTVMGLSELVIDIRLKVAVQTKADIAKDRCDFAREWRNKKLAHTDLETLRTGHASGLPAVNTTNIEDGIGATQDVLTPIADHYGHPHVISISNPWGSKSLVSYLEHSKKLRDMEEASWKDV